MFRHAWSHRQLFSNKRPTGAIYGAISGLCRLARTFPGAAIVFCWDGDKSKKSWRHELASTYKANRENKGGKPEDWVKYVHYQIPLFGQFLKIMGFQQFEIKGLEADDLLGILSRRAEKFADRIIIYSTDRDMYQLIGGKVEVVRDTDKKKKCRPIKIKEIKAEYGVEPKDWLKFRALVGDKGDNINKAVKGVGPKTAVKLVHQGLDASQKKFPKNKELKEYKPFWKAIRLNYKLSKILRKPDSHYLDQETKAELERMLYSYQAFSDMFRYPKHKEKEYYKLMVKFLAEFEMEELVRRRHEIWKIK